MSVLLHAREKWGVCRCGHYDWQHDDCIIGENGDIISRGDGHGRCGFEDCDCKQFTWVYFETADWKKQREAKK